MTITIEPIAGLANRMRVVDGAATLAEKLGVRLRVIWTRTVDFNCRFDSIFEPPPKIAIVERKALWNKVLRQTAIWTGAYDPALRQKDVEERLNRGVGFADLGKLRAPFLITCSRIHATEGALRRFVPQAMIREAAARWTGRFDRPTVGVHIRRAGHDLSQRSPTALFLKAMQAEIEAEPGTMFFVATDEPAELPALEAAFPNRIITRRPNVLDRNRAEGIVEGAVDLYCLARTNRIIGTFQSSFSEAAATIGGVGLTVIDSERS